MVKLVTQGPVNVGSQLKSNDAAPAAPAGPSAKVETPATQWSARSAGASGPSSGPAAGGVPDILRTQTESLTARWALDRHAESQPDWEAKVKQHYAARSAARADTPDVDRICNTIGNTIDQLKTLARTNPKSPDVAALYDGLASSVETLTKGQKGYEVPDAVKSRVFQAMLPALDPSLLQTLTADKKHNALAQMPRDFLFQKLGGPLFDALQHASPDVLGKAFVGMAASAAADSDKGSRKQLAKEALPNAVVHMYPDVPHHSEPVAPFPNVPPGWESLVGPQIAAAVWFKGIDTEKLDKKPYGTGDAKINWRQELDQLGKGGDHATRALSNIQRFIDAQAPNPAPPASTP
jgi:hypothetical protein